jgi:hypothetical protein
VLPERRIAIARSLEKLDLALASRVEDIRWKAAMKLGEYCENDPGWGWPLVVKWGSSDDDDARDAIACCVLEHILQYHFDEYFEKCVQLIRDGNLNFGHTLSKCYRMGEAEIPENSKRMDDILSEYDRLRERTGPGGT